MTELSGLRGAFASRQRDERVQRMWRIIEERQSGPRLVNVWRYALVAVGVGLSLAAALFLTWPRGSNSSLTLAAGQPVPERMGAGHVVNHRLSDGSAFRTGAGAELELLKNTRSTMVFAVRRGRVRYGCTTGAV